MIGKILDTSLNLRRIVDVFNSFIWNEPYIGYGDFELRIPMTSSALDYIKDGWYVSIEESDKLMIIEHIAIETDVQNGNYAVVSGRSLESILLRRVLYSSTTLTGSFETSIMRLLNSNFLTASNSNRRATKLIYVPSGDTYISGLTVESEYDPGENLYDIIYSLCEYERVGFKITPNYDENTFEFRLYNGVDRSYDQQSNPWVVFSAKYENLKSSNMSLDTQELKNVCHVENRFTVEVAVTDPDTGESTTKSEERVMTETINDNISDLDRREIFVSCQIKPEEVDKAQFGKKEDRVNIRDYQVYDLLYFDSKGYKEACAKVDDKYSSRIDERKEVTVARPTKTTIGIVVGAIVGIGLGGAIRPRRDGTIKERDKEMMLANRATKAVDTTPPDWITNTGKPKDTKYWTYTKEKESIESWQKRNARTFAAWEKAYPDRSKYETWGWVFKPGGESAYNQALAEAQAAIDAEYNAAVNAEIEKTREQMRALGMIELAPYLIISNFEGEVDPNVQFIFGRDYNLGDIVQIVNEYDFQAKTRVVSMLFSQEEGEGYKAIPTFESDDPSEVEL